MPKFMAVRRRKARKALRSLPVLSKFRRTKTRRFGAFESGRLPSRQSPATFSRSATGFTRGTMIMKPYSRYNLNPFPSYMPINVRYADIQRTCAITTGGVCNASFLYRLNDIFDPYNGVGGGGPINWYSQLAAIYNNYIIWAADIQVTFYDPTINTLVGAVLVHSTDDADDPNGKTADYFLQRDNYETVRLTSLTGNGSTGTIAAHIKLWEIEGITFQQWCDQTSKYGAAIGADPSKPLYARIGCADLGGNNTGSCVMDIQITFHGKCYGLKTA